VKVVAKAAVTISRKPILVRKARANPFDCPSHGVLVGAWLKVDDRFSSALNAIFSQRAVAANQETPAAGRVGAGRRRAAGGSTGAASERAALKS